jgi:hypothetical protein
MSERSANPYMKSDPDLDAKIRSCSDPAELQQLLAQLMAARGVRTRGTDGTFDSNHEVEVPQSPSSVAKTPAASTGNRCMRVFYPHDNARFEIYGASEQELDQQEQRVRSLYPSQR